MREVRKKKTQTKKNEKLNMLKQQNETSNDVNVPNPACGGCKKIQDTCGDCQAKICLTCKPKSVINPIETYVEENTTCSGCTKNLCYDCTNGCGVCGVSWCQDCYKKESSLCDCDLERELEEVEDLGYWDHETGIPTEFFKV